jgi:hypothetical protein
VEIYRQSRVLIALLAPGGGKKGKIGEALSYGLPVVTTSIGSEGFDLKMRKIHSSHAVQKSL